VKRRAIPTAPEPLETSVQHVDELFGKSNQREGFRQYLEGLSERNTTLTGRRPVSPGSADLGQHRG
jgi:hypothetical protein